VSRVVKNVTLVVRSLIPFGRWEDDLHVRAFSERARTGANAAHRR
jgi:hypothetical protein